MFFRRGAGVAPEGLRIRRAHYVSSHLGVGLVCGWGLGSKPFLEPCSYCTLVFWPLILQVRGLMLAWALFDSGSSPRTPPPQSMETFSSRLCFWSCLGFLCYFFSSALRSFALKTPPFVSVMALERWASIESPEQRDSEAPGARLLGAQVQQAAGGPSPSLAFLIRTRQMMTHRVVGRWSRTH